MKKCDINTKGGDFFKVPMPSFMKKSSSSKRFCASLKSNELPPWPNQTGESDRRRDRRVTDIAGARGPLREHAWVDFLRRGRHAATEEEAPLEP